MGQINADGCICLDGAKQCTLFDKFVEDDFRVIRTNNLSSINDVWNTLYKVINKRANIIDSILNGQLSQDYIDKYPKTILPTTKKNTISSKFTTKKRKEPTFKIFSEKTCSTHRSLLDIVCNTNGRDKPFIQLHINRTTHPVLDNNNNTMVKNVKRIARNTSSIYPTSQIVLKYKPYLKADARNDSSTYLVNVKNANIILKKMAKNAIPAYPILVNNNTALKITTKNDSSNQSTTLADNIIIKTIVRKDNSSDLLHANVQNNTSKRIARNSNLTHFNMENSGSMDVTQYFNQTVAPIVSTKGIIQIQTEQNVKVPKLSNVVKLSENVFIDGYVGVVFVLLLIATSKCNYYYYLYKTFFNDIYYFCFKFKTIY